MPNKQICPHCGRKFVNLSRHKCKVAPPVEETKTKTKKKSAKKSKSSAKKKSSPKSTKSEIAEKSRTKENSKKSFSSIDKEILSLIETRKIIYQDEIIEIAESKYDIDAKNVEKSLFRLSNRQKITIQSDLKGGIRKDRIDFIEEYEIKNKSSMKKKGDVASWTVVEDCPCFLCPEVIKCNVGNNSYSVSVINREKQILTNPYYCSYIKRWIDCKVGEIEYHNPFKGGAYFGKKKKKKARAKPKH
jgi:hypothetical protein